MKKTQERPVTPAALKPLKWTATTRKNVKSTGTATKGVMDWVKIKSRTVSKARTHLTSKPLQGLFKRKRKKRQLQGI